MIGLMGAMDIEVAAIKLALQGQQTSTILGNEVISGELDGTPVLVVKCGVGKVNATLAAAALAQAGVGRIVFTGVAGGVGEGVKVGDVVIATDLVQHDVDVTAFGYEPGQQAGEPLSWSTDQALSDALAATATRLHARVHRGRIASGDQFISSDTASMAIRDRFGAIAVEMEGAAVAQAAAHLGLPFAVVRWISDTADEDAVTDFPAFIKHAAGLDLEIVRGLLNSQ